jgi:hypothetical protein
MQGAASTAPERTLRVREERMHSGNAADGHSWTGSERVVNPARLTVTPEWPIAVSGFFLNFFWEMAQSGLYADVARKTYQKILVSRLHCTLGDVAILLVAYWITTGLVRNRYWVTALRPRDLAAFTGLGLGYTMVSEWVNVDLGARGATPRRCRASRGSAPGSRRSCNG